MNFKTRIFSTLVLVCAFLSVDAHVNPEYLKQMKDRVQLAGARMDCQPAQSQIDMEINNVRARLLTGGDVWWNLDQGRYIVPKPVGDGAEVSALFAGGVWIGGVDPNNNVKLAGVTYRSGNQTDFYAGPLDDQGEADLDLCENWDQFFVVTGADIRKHIANFDKSLATGIPYSCDSIPESIKYWPGRGNPFWGERYNFDIPDQNLGDFWDEPGSSAGYNPCEGDFPVIDIVGCEPDTRKEARELLPDEVTFWVYNDKGGLHRLTQGPAIQMEVQVQAFAYATNDEINDMTFYRYKLLNRATDYLQNCYFAMWVDPDLGCFSDDYIGCDVERSLAYVYNEDAADGDPGTTCPGGVETYKEDIPILGIDYFRGPREPRLFVRDENDNVVLGEDGKPLLRAYNLDINLGPVDDVTSQDTLIELGMTSFVYQNSGSNNEPPATIDPQNDQEFYNVLRGLWRDGTAVTFGGTGYDPAAMDSIRFAFPDAPNDETGWSMCTANLDFGDRRTVQATGPLLLQPGAKNELIIGVVFVPNIDYPCPEISKLQSADDLAQALFDNCFNITDGPDAPDMFAVELDRQLVLVLSNDSLEIESNNAGELYSEADLQAPPGIADSLYRFEGYKIYQLKNPNVSVQELDNIEIARLIRQVDVKNDVTEIYNWRQLPNPDPNPLSTPNVYIPERQVDGRDQGISHSFNVLTDQFASTDRRLVNHKNYYYTVVAYGYNNYGQYDPTTNEGQRRAYLEGRRNIRTYTYTPRPVVYKELATAYGQEAEVTRLHGIGTGLNTLDLTDGTMEAILDGSIATTDSGTVVLTYKAGNGPINPKVIDPLNIKNGKYRLEIVGDYTESNRDPRITQVLDDNDEPIAALGARWKLTNVTTGQVIASEKSIEELNEQIVYEQGFSVSVNQVGEPGSEFEENNGARTQVYQYADVEEPVEWFNAVPAFSGTVITPDENDPETTFNVYNWASQEVSSDPDNELSQIDDGYWIPMLSTRWAPENQFYITPGWQENLGFSRIQDRIEHKFLNNVNIVFTSDKTKWSECVVVESAVGGYNDGGLATNGSVSQFDLRASTSIDVDGDPIEGSTGKSYFPGYAIDVETGERLNIFFGENSVFNAENDAILQEQAPGLNINTAIGDDMIWNPSTELFATGQPFGGGLYNTFAGGQHYVYVTRTPYDGCAVIHENLESGGLINKINAVGTVTWASMPVPQEPLLSLADGLIPTDLTVKLRVASAFNRELDIANISSLTNFNTKGDMPVYEFEFGDVEARSLAEDDLEGALDNVRVVPNPYYAYSSYEQSQFENIIKVTNLPPRSIVTIYTLDGKFIQQFNRDAMPRSNAGNNPALAESQIAPAVEWNLTNDKGVPVASGVYIFHIKAYEKIFLHIHFYLFCRSLSNCW